ncbi:hypothetical protein [Benzoatithermus flavus]|uniref:Uncharacterized protein n=1 Tax=Benzoatithermus flavus TaxID=3108223 RepID=A0ABU8XSK2_9PROT
MAKTTIFAARHEHRPQRKAAPKPKPAPMPPVLVNGTAIPEAEIGRELQYHPGGSLAQAWQRAATALVVRELLRQRCEELGIRGGSEDERIDALLRAEVTTPEPDEITCRRWYDQNRHKFAGREFPEAKALVTAYLRDMSWSTACSQYVRLLVGRARIEGLDLEGAESPLLQ